MKYQKLPVVIDAIKLTPETRQQVQDFLGDTLLEIHPEETGEFKLVIGTLEGPHNATYDDYIIRGIKGEFYPCKSDIFEATYKEFDPGVATQDTEEPKPCFTKEQEAEFAEVTTMVSEFLKKHGHQHMTVLITQTNAELVEGLMCATFHGEKPPEGVTGSDGPN